MATWQEIYTKLDPFEPLEVWDERLARELYVGDFFRSIKKKLLINAAKRYKLLLYGHTGCGKSTFLNLVSEDDEIKQRFHVVNYSLQKRLLDTNDIDHIDLLLTMASEVFLSLPQSNLSPLLKADAEKLAKELQELLVRENSAEDAQAGALGGEASVGFDLFGFFKDKLFARFKFEQETRKRVREYFRPRISDFLNQVNAILQKVEIQTGKELLIVIDDTDKLPAEKGRSVFFENGHHLASVQANVIFVVDLSVSTYSEFPQIRSKFSGDEFFPAIKVRERDRSQSEDTKRYVAILAALAGRRVPAEFIDEEALARAIELTGGVVRELIRILNYAIFAAEGKIQLDHVEGAANKIANEFNLYGEHTLIMHKVLDDPDWLAREEAGDKEKVILSLLHMPALFQYRNGEIKWYRPYPVFDGWLKRLYPGPQLLT